MKIFTHFRTEGIYRQDDNGLTYRWNGTAWEPCVNIPPDDMFRVVLKQEEFPALYRRLPV